MKFDLKFCVWQKAMHRFHSASAHFQGKKSLTTRIANTNEDQEAYVWWDYMSKENKKVFGNQQLISNAVEHLATAQRLAFWSITMFYLYKKRQPQIKTN